MKTVVVEPIPSTFAKLQQAYAGVPNVQAIQAALARTDGSATIYKVKEGAAAMDAYWSILLASFDKAHLLKHGLKEHEVESIQVPSLTLRTLLARCGLTCVDVLQVDTEGFDAEVVKMALELEMLPGFISFENIHLDNTARRDVFARLEAADYRWTHDSWNTLAVHSGVLEALNRF